MSPYIRRFLTACLSLASVYACNAQDEPKLTVPSSPAFSILNFEPSAVLRPTSNRALATDVLNSFDKQGKLLTNLALEVSPYWLKSRSALTREIYLKTKNPLKVFLHTFTLSAASVKDSASGDHKLGTGFRCKILNGKPVDELADAEAELKHHQKIQGILTLKKDQIIKKNLTSIKDAIAEVESILNTAIALDPSALAVFDGYAQAVAGDFKNDTESVKKFIEKLCDDYMGAQKRAVDNVADLNEKRRGFILEFAGATGFNNSQGNSLERAGLWINGSTYLSGSDLLTVTARYMFQNRDSALSNVDIGLGYIKQAGSFNVSIEALVRFWSSKRPITSINGEVGSIVKNTVNYRLAAQASYSITNTISVNLSIGKAFDEPRVTSSAFFSILGFNYSLFRNLN